MCTQRRHRSVCAYALFDHSLRCLFEEVLSLFFTVMVLAPVPPGFSRRKTAGISETYAFSNPRCLPGLSRIIQYDPVLSRLVPSLGLCTYGVTPACFPVDADKAQREPVGHRWDANDCRHRPIAPRLCPGETPVTRRRYPVITRGYKSGLNRISSV